MFRLSYDYPTVENTELLSTYSRTSPQLYSSIATSDKYLLRYASNTWNIQFPNCVFHPELNAIRIITSFESNTGSIIFDIPYQSLGMLGFQQYPDPTSNTITLECLCEIYFLAETILIRLPTTIPLRQIYNELPDDGLTFIIPYLNIKENKIKDNLTKLSLNFINNNEIIIYPLQRFPPQPLAQGIFQISSNLTPLQSLQLVNDAIIQGTELSKDMSKYLTNMKNNLLTPISSLSSRSITPPPTSNYKQAFNDIPEIMDTIPDMGITLSQSGQGDDDEYSFDFNNNNHCSSNLKLETMGGMHVEMIGGFNSVGVKRSRRESDDTITNIPSKLSPRQKKS
jgi:hypothetical protein